MIGVMSGVKELDGMPPRKPWNENSGEINNMCLQLNAMLNEQTCSLQLSDSVYWWEYYRTGKNSFLSSLRYYAYK